MTPLRIVGRLLVSTREVIARIEALQSKTNILKASIANSNEREKELREKENEWRDAHNIKRGQS